MFDQSYYDERKRDLEEETKRASQRLVNGFLSLFNEGHLELIRLSDKRREILAREAEYKRQEELRLTLEAEKKEAKVEKKVKEK